ncbi:MAG: DUF169 domain-containing protein [Chloroflexi bacterium]|nr:DUF169 domain-containing protein [Chloroflexota bacterium]
MGVKVYRHGEKFEDPGFPPPEKRLTFCRFVREAASGKDFLVKVENLNCPNAEVTLGFREPKYVNIEPRIKEKTAALRVGPLEGADVVLLLLTPEQVMTMSILLGGVNAKFKGDMAVCGEAMAHVYTGGGPNVTFLCNGARTYGGYESNELIMALPYSVFIELPAKMGKFASLSKKAKDGLRQLLLRVR